MSNGYSKDKNHRINDQYGICWDAPRTLRGSKVGNCWRVYDIASGRDQYAKYDTAEQAVAAAEALAAHASQAKAEAPAPAPAAPAPAVESVKRSPSPAERAHRVGQSLGINGGIWDESEMYR